MSLDDQSFPTSGLASQRDGDLLRRYVATRSEAAFAELGRRYAGLVYATCLRETQDRALAEDAAQGVFLLLSQKAGALQRSETIAGWLYVAARNVARNLMKQERRRLMHEASAALAAAPEEEIGNALWERIEPHLHDALDRLKPEDREAVLLRFVAERSFAEVGSRLGLSENTARMRVGRAVEKIRAHLGKVGIAASAAALAMLLEERAAQAAPARLLQSLPQIAAGNGQAVTTGAARLAVQSGTRQIARFNLPALGALGGALILLVGFTIYHSLQPQRLNAAEQRQLYARLAGVWSGTLEFADDRTQQHSTYPTSVTFQAQEQGNTLEFTATYTGTSSVDTTTFRTEPRTGMTTVRNGGPQSSHQLNAAGEILRTHGDYVFQGDDAGLNAAARVLIQPNGNSLTIQEEYRKAGQASYQFRNRFTLSRP